MRYSINTRALLFAVVFTVPLSVQNVYTADNASVYDHRIWLNNTIGIQSNQLPDFPIVEQSTTSVDVGNKSFELLNEFLPSQIRVGSDNLLMAPIELEIDGVTVDKNHFESTSIIQSNEALSHTDRRFAIANYQVENQIKVSPDGFVGNTIKIIPRKRTTINSLKIKIKLNKEFATSFEKYFPYDFVKQQVIRKDGEHDNQSLDSSFSLPFTPIMWFGNSAVGLEILMENNISYSLLDPNKTNQIDVNESYIQLTHTIIDKPVRINKPLVYNIGILPTPTKDKNKQPRNFLLTSKSKRVSSESKFSEIHIGHWKRDGFPFPGIPELAEPGSPERRIFDRKKNKLNKQSIIYIPYSALHIMVSTLPELVEFRKEWASGNANKGSIHLQSKINHPRPSQPVTLESQSIQNYLLHKHTTYQSENGSKGIYVDVAMPNQVRFTTRRKISQTDNRFNRSAVHFPIFSHRAFLQRYWSTLKEQSSDFLIVHHGNKLPHYAQSFIDIAVIGESIHTRFMKRRNISRKKINGKQAFSNPENYEPNYLSLSPLDFPGIGTLNSGTRQAIIPQIVKFNDDYLAENPEIFEKWTRSFIATALLNDMQMWNTRLKSGTFKKIIKSLEKFPEYASAKFTSNPLSFNDSEIKNSIYSGKETSLLVLVNYGKTKKNVVLTPQVFEQSNDKYFKFINLEENTNLTKRSKDTIIEIPAEDFRMLLMTNEN